MGDWGGESVNHLTTYKFCRHSCVLVNFTTELIAMKVVSSLKDRTGGGRGDGICQPLINYKFCRHSCVLVNFTTELIAMKEVSSLKDRTRGGWWEP